MVDGLLMGLLWVWILPQCASLVLGFSRTTPRLIRRTSPCSREMTPDPGINSKNVRKHSHRAPDSVITSSGESSLREYDSAWAARSAGPVGSLMLPTAHVLLNYVSRCKTVA